MVNLLDKNTTEEAIQHLRKVDKDFLVYVKNEIRYLVDNGLSLKNAAKIIADIFDLPRKDIYNTWIDKN